jgi:hypothetical protein
MNKQSITAHTMKEDLDNFVNQKKNPTIEEYLKVDLEKVLARLNKNPSGNESEAEVVNAVIAVRHAKVIEKLNHRLVCLTGLAALATAANVLAPFLAPSIEAKRLNEAMTSANTSIDKLKSESQFMKQQIQQLKQALSISRQKPANSSIRAAHKN